MSQIHEWNEDNRIAELTAALAHQQSVIDAQKYCIDQMFLAGLKTSGDIAKKRDYDKNQEKKIKDLEEEIEYYRKEVREAHSQIDFMNESSALCNAETRKEERKSYERAIKKLRKEIKKLSKKSFHLTEERNDARKMLDLYQRSEAHTYEGVDLLTLLFEKCVLIKKFHKDVANMQNEVITLQEKLGESLDCRDWEDSLMNDM